MSSREPGWDTSPAAEPLTARIVAVLLRGVVPAAALLWVVVLVAAPWVLSHRPAGSPEVVVSEAVYAGAGRICHQVPARSFKMWGRVSPVCGRCTGLYVGAAAGFLAAWSPAFIGRRRRPGVQPVDLAAWRAALVASAIPSAVLFVVEQLAPGPWRGPGPAMLRAVAAVPLGAAVAWVIWRAAPPWPRRRG